jgi:hypothetical protein
MHENIDTLIHPCIHMMLIVLIGTEGHGSQSSSLSNGSGTADYADDSDPRHSKVSYIHTNAC